MNRYKNNRIISLLLCLCLVLALFAGVFSVSAVGENAIRNWGVRDTVCTQLSSAAQSYYTGSNTYAALKTLTGASGTTNSLTAAQNNNLFNALHTLMEDTHTTVNDISYNSHATWYAYTDCENGDTSGKMKLLWAGGYRTWDGTYVNREHVWCKSHATYVETNGGADLHHLRPASAYVNQTPHNNRPYGSANAHGGTTCVDENNNFGGWVLYANSDWSDGQYEPPDNAKGDCARILLYVYTRWKQPNLYTSLDTSSSAYRNFVEETPSGTCDGVACIESLETLLQWCHDDPVDTWEMGRNDSVQSIQGNRNVFIDYPELAWYMFGLTPPSDMTTPSGDAANGAPAYQITNVSVNNASYGSAVITNSNTVTVSPAAGCYIVSATATSGTVSISGNVITVSGMTANATVNVVLARNVSYTISFSTPSGVSQANMTGYANSTITLPTPTGTPTANAQNYEFFGWTTGAVNDTTTQPAYYAAGSSYTVTGNATLTALYRYNAAGSGGAAAFDPSGNGGTFVLAANVDNTYYALPVSGLGQARPGGSEITVTDGAVTATNASGYEWTLTKSGSSFNISCGSTYLTWSSSTSLGSSSEAYDWIIEANDTTTWKIIPSGASSGTIRSLIFRAGSYNVFGGYSVSNLGGDYKAIEILPIGSGAATQTYYTTNLQSSCNHSYGSAVPNGAAGHTYTCTDCGYSFTEAHHYTTSTSGLTTTYTCTICGYSYQTTLGNYTVTYNVRGSVNSTDTVTEGSSVTLPAAPAYTGYTFCGWATSAINPETETAPTVLTGSYTPTSSITLYAVYSHVVEGGGSGNSSYVLVTNTNQLVSGRNLIIAAKDFDYAMADIYSTYYRNQGAVTKSGNTLTPGSSVIPFTLGTGSSSGTWTLYDTKNDAYLSAYISGSYYDLGAQGTVDANTSFAISVGSDGTASLTTNSGTCVVKYFRNTSYEEYKCVSASTTANIYDITLYVETPTSADATFYTTQPAVVCSHSNTTLTGAAAATCTAAGYTGDTVCDDCGTTVSQGTAIPALGHSYASSVITPATCTSSGVRTFTCSRCSDTYTEPIAALNHDYSSTVTTAATCGTAGVRTYTCSRCGDTYTESIPATGDHHYDSGSQTQAPSCLQAGETTFTCTTCGSTYTAPIAALGHDYGSCVSNNDGTHCRTCSRCGDVITDSCSFTSSVQGDICTYICSGCGYSYTEQLDTWTITLRNCDVPAEYFCVDGNEFTFPNPGNVTIEDTDYTFVGWVASRVEETTVRPGTIHTAGESYTPGKSMTYYALYSGSTPGDSTEEYRLVTAASQFAAGDEVVIAARSAAYALRFNNNRIERTSVNKSNNNANLTVNSATVFTLGTGTQTGTWSFKSGSNYLAVNNNNITIATTTGYPTSWTIGSIDATNGGAVLSAKRSASEQVRYLRYAQNNFSTTNNSANTVVLYKKYILSTSVTSYTTELVTHVHSYTGEVTTPATCTQNGVMTYTCDCGDSYTEVIAASGHDYGAWSSNSNGTHSKTCANCGDVITEACSYTSVTSGATTTFTCTVCSYSYSDTLDTYTVTYSNCGVTTTESCIEGSSVTLPGGSEVDGYTFLGWVTLTINPENKTEPEILTGSYEPTASVTLYAVYSRSEGSVEPGTLTKMAAGDTLASGDKIVIIAHGTDYIMHRSHYYVNYVDYAEGANTISAAAVDADALLYWNVSGSESAWVFGDSENGNLYTTGSNTLYTSAENTTTFALTDNNDGTFYLKADARYLSCRTDLTSSYAKYWRLSSGTGTCILDLYKYVPGPNTLEVWYTTSPDTGCTHDSVIFTNYQAATCTADGYSGDYICAYCGETVENGSTIPALGHAYVNHEAQAATCTAIGWNAYQTCSRCDYSSYMEIAALGHDIVIDPAVPATCLNTGLTAGEHCTRCDYSVAREVTNALGHDWDDGEVTTAATIYSTGIMTYHCKRCDATKTEEIPRLNHTHYAYRTAAAAATCTTAGNSEYYYCYGCGKYFSDSACNNEIAAGSWVIAAIGHDYVNGVCTRCGDKILFIRSASVIVTEKYDVAYTVQLPSGYSSPSMTFTGPNGTITTSEYTRTGEYYVFTYSGVNPQCIGDTITATLTATKNWTTEETVSVDNYSVRQYCVNKLADESISSELRTLCSDILAYGAAAQAYMNYKTNELVNSGEDIVNPAYSSFQALSGMNAGFSGTADANYKWLGAGLTLTNSVAMTFRFYAADTNYLRVKVTLNGTTMTFSATDFTAVDGIDNVYEVSLTGITADDFDETVTASFERYYSPIGNTVSYSVNTYVCAKQTDANTALANLVKALYNYGAAAEAYLAN